MKRLFFVFIMSLIFSFGFEKNASAQCALCKESAETSLQEGKKDAAGLNTGIIYLLLVPYLLVGGIGYFWYRRSKKFAAENNEEI